MIAEIQWDGKKISKPGLYAGVDMASYHGSLTEGDSVSSGVLRTMWSESPADVWVNSPSNPNRRPALDKPQFAFGRASHTLLLEGRAAFDAEFVLSPFDDFRTKEARAWRDQMAADKKTVITEADLANVEGMAASLARHPLVRAGVLDGLIERSLVYQDEETGLWVKSRPDVIPTDGADGCDFKTCMSVTDDSIQRSITNFGYHSQGGLIGSAFKAVLNTDMTSFALVFCQKVIPWSVRVITIPPADLQLGEQQNRWAMRKFRECLDSGFWPGPGGEAQDAEPMGLMPYARARIEARLGLAAQERAQAGYEREWAEEHEGEDE